jgi:hypothetical protein
MKIKTPELTRAALNWAVHVALHGSCEGYAEHEYSTDWSQGGPIIEREGITVGPDTGLDWWVAHIKGGIYIDHGPTPLIAGMRCYVASKLGDEVEVPDGLV